MFSLFNQNDPAMHCPCPCPHPGETFERKDPEMSDDDTGAVVVSQCDGVPDSSPLRRGSQLRCLEHVDQNLCALMSGRKST